MVSGLRGTTYPDKLNEVGLTTLEARRSRGDMLLTWRARSGNIGIGPNHWFTPCESQYTIATRHSSSVGNIVKPKFSHEVRKNFFTVRAVDPWNSLPTAIKHSTTINKFKAGYDSFMKR